MMKIKHEVNGWKYITTDDYYRAGTEEKRQQSKNRKTSNDVYFSMGP